VRKRQEPGLRTHQSKCSRSLMERAANFSPPETHLHPKKGTRDPNWGRPKSKIKNQQSSIVNPSSIFNVRSPSLQGALPRREWPVARQKIGDWRFPHSKVPKSKIQNQQSSIVNPSSISNVRSPSLQGALPRREWPVARFQGSVRRVKSECSSFFASATACQSHLPVFSPDLPCLFQQEEESLTIVD
jgi:hypothetical protein